MMATMPPAEPESNVPTFAVEVRAPARLHLGMMAFGSPQVRSFGGVGVMVDRPGTVVRVRRAARFEARGSQAERAVMFARACAQAWGLHDAACAIDVIAAPRSHVGLGSGTQMGLAVAAAMRHLFMDQPHDELPAPPQHPLQPEPDAADHELAFDIRESLELARTVGRGRRSCVGVYGFSRGGLIVEAGRTVPATVPVEDDATREFSPMVARVRLPSAWRCVVITGRDAVGLSGEAEKAAFGTLPPVPQEVSAELARIALLELLPAAVEGKFADFSAAVRAYGRMAGKPFEPASRQLPYASATENLLELLGELGATGAAQSSWGPAVMACCESLDEAGELIDRLETLGLARHHEITIARFDPQGATLRVLE
jgi:beta-ribofuranosylaminobenzene 5'-phosphate synthase